MWIDIAIPSSFTSNYDSMIQRTYAVAYVARFCSIYRVRTIFIYRDPLNPSHDVSRQVIKLFRYFITPPYLRKLLFPLDRDLSYVGIAPPINLELFKDRRPIKELELPDIRLGTPIKYVSGSTVLDVGLDKPALVDGKLLSGRVYPIRINKVTSRYLRGELITHGVYFGYRVVRVREKLPSFLESRRCLRIGTSRFGDLYFDVRDALIRDLAASDDVLIVFGSHGYGLVDILDHWGVKPMDVFDYFLNLVGGQGTVTIRVEEAVPIALAVVRAVIELFK